MCSSDLASLRGAYIGYTDLAEQGGDAGLLIQNRNMKSVQGRLGATVKSEMGGVKPFLTANYVHEFKDQPAFIQANLIGGLGNGAAFALGGQDQDWGEIGGGLTVGTGAMNISLSADTTVARKDVKYQTYRASVKIAF